MAALGGPIPTAAELAAHGFGSGGSSSGQRGLVTTARAEARGTKVGGQAPKGSPRKLVLNQYGETLLGK